MNSMNNVPIILKSTQPLLYETGFEEWQYAYAGSCFPVRWKESLYIISAYHCYENHQIAPEKTLYSIPSDQRSFFGFCNTLRGKVEGTSDQKHYDQIALEVSSEIHSKTDLDSVVALDLSTPKNSISLSDSSLSDVWLRGFVLDNPAHEICYENSKIRQQAYVTNGMVSSRKSTFDHCHMVKVKTPIPEGFSPRGMSGSAVYGVDRHGNVRFGGMVIEFNEYTNEYMVIDSAVLAGVLYHENASQSH
ncbi:hypothetical protein LCGC14_0479240 [marine sediment metagenome]|uniref:Peptidase S1 domain-containing protein n=1 Tax=marine sediment metagenome TaxID=412755 RepID=A0A0F9SF91_9ZZZZ